MGDYPIYNEWEVVHSDCGLEARKDPLELEAYGVGLKRDKKEATNPMFLLHRGSLGNIVSRLSISEGNRIIFNNISNAGTSETEYKEFRGRGHTIDTINVFLHATYIRLAQEGKVMI